MVSSEHVVGGIMDAVIRLSGAVAPNVNSKWKEKQKEKFIYFGMQDARVRDVRAKFGGVWTSE